MRNFKLLFALVLALFAASVANATELFNDAPGTSTQFGWGPGASNNRYAIGRPGTETVVVFNRDGDVIQTVGPQISEFGAGFGRVVELSEDGQWLLVTAIFSDKCGAMNAGAGFLYEWDGTAYADEQLLCATDPQENAEVGRDGAVNENGSVIVLGAYKKDTAYVYYRVGDTLSPKKLFPEDVVVGVDNAAFCVAASEDTVVLTSPYRTKVRNGVFSLGEVNIFQQDEGGENNFGRIYSGGVSGSKALGYSCAASMPDVAVGDHIGGPAAASGTGSGGGRGMVFVLDVGWGSVASEGVINNPNDGADEFGHSIALWHANLKIGAPFTDVNSVVDAGKSYGYSRTLSGWSPDFTRTPEDPTTLDRHGWRTAAAGGAGIDASPWVDKDFVDEGAAFVTSFHLIYAEGHDWNSRHWSFETGMQ